MKVTLISPYLDIQPFGLRTLSAHLKREGHNVQLIFLPRYFTDRYEDETLDDVVEISRGTDLIGISLTTNFFDNVIQITQRLKKDLNIQILWGGIHPTIRPEECLNYADMVCVGEGEEALVELARKMENAKDYHDVRGVWFKKNGKIIKNKNRPLIQDLDSILFPDFRYDTQYILSDGHVQLMNESLLEKHMRTMVHVGTMYTTVATRGCPFGCTYCCNNTLNRMYSGQKIVRKRSTENLIKEMMKAKSILPFIKSFGLADDLFFIRTIEEIKEFCEKYKENVRLPLHIGGANPSNLTMEKLATLVDAGLKNFRLGIQTGSERTKILFRRYYSNKQVEEVVKAIHTFKDKIRRPLYDIILDNPWETEEDLKDTLMFLSKFPTPYALNLYSLTFYPETELYWKAKKDGIITDDLEEVYRKVYHDCRNTYLNRLFFLLKRYTVSGWRIPTKIMWALTNRTLRKLKVSQLIYIILKIQYMLYECLNDMRKGDRSRILRYITKGRFTQHISHDADMAAHAAGKR
ncbi:MAG: B12-binding domain-containing radical SAM protein [bacterium]|nr:MAG: B12-binding domain-containing radical SAM protein [bacterium]